MAHGSVLLIVPGLAALAAVLVGCGGDGGGPSPSPSPPPGPPPGPVDCPAVMKRGHCTSCFWTGSATTCKACSGDYELDASPSSPELSCSFNCSSFKPQAMPPFPASATQLNGIQWPTVCIGESVSRFFTIGDWGGVCGWGKGNQCHNGTKPAICVCGPECGDEGKPCPMPNRPAGLKAIDGVAQRLVSDRMLARQEELVKAGTPAHFIVNVGDNFYPGGIDYHCGVGDKSAMATQFKQVWKDMYPGELSKLEWWGVLGNHDYGGTCYIKGWDQQIFYTWHDDKWVMPAQYWRRTVQYKNFKADFFFLDGNVYDTTPGTIASHDICSVKSNPGLHCELANYPGDGANCAATGPHDQPSCKGWFKKLWEDNVRWLKDNLPKSDAEWQILVNHYPASFSTGYAPESYMDWSKFLEPMGVDLYISGHTHEQGIYYGDFGPGRNMGASAWVITGGGGGVTSEEAPHVNGEDDSYGYMEIVLSLESINVTTYSHGGRQGRNIIRNSTSVAPVARHSYMQLVRAGLLKREETPEGSLSSESELIF
uniref:Calcineurin-like phosphoesterase domain-containing protein n=1 Tax=Alexandrium catenella TaxID=2925 RepID=A0A7S1LQE7_ALECA